MRLLLIVSIAAVVVLAHDHSEDHPHTTGHDRHHDDKPTGTQDLVSTISIFNPTNAPNFNTNPIFTKTEPESSVVTTRSTSTPITSSSAAAPSSGSLSGSVDWASSSTAVPSSAANTTPAQQSTGAAPTQMPLIGAMAGGIFAGLIWV